ncbi:oligopeptide transport ATP-binding protein OppD [Oxobacter pfennigii]|uniref:Oligopeptide transport ATP-binding protein OppD n=1 Tax=Oxobacter pfennigii TaxID=36849 RepID=A0A0P8WPH7_9CLOT|nr:ABC transporter ATP-binding protein [Oxobacter pfennigii]KPU44451.1 oligopeptide transport ATP-binding protein OppD [Oxobacter pfennigii]
MPLDVRNLTISLTSGEKMVDNISFSIAKGEMLSIVGSSGAGKTTVCRTVMGLLDTNYIIQGRVDYSGENLLALAKGRLQKIYGKEVCYILQNPMTAFNPSVRIGKQLEKTYLKHNDDISKTEIFTQVEPILRRLGMEDTKRIWKSYPFALSGGMLQRVMIAAALMNSPRLLIADEVTTAIDACNRMGLMKELRKLCDEGMSVLFVTHDLRSAANSNQILIMNHGKMVEYGSTQKIMESPKEDYTKYLLGACRLERRERA